MIALSQLRILGQLSFPYTAIEFLNKLNRCKTLVFEFQDLGVWFSTQYTMAPSDLFNIIFSHGGM